MKSTAEFVTWLEAQDDTDGLCEVLRVDFDPEEFITSIKSSERLRPMRSFDGYISTVRDTADPDDKSRQGKTFDMHTDGFYCNPPPDLVILYCVDPGTTGAATVIGDSGAAIAATRDHLSLLRMLDFVYLGRGMEESTRPLIEPHPGTGASISNVATRGYVRPQVTQESLATLSDFKDFVSALQHFYAAIDASVTLTHQWSRNDLLIFDNHRYLHARRGAGHDPDRTLIRLWLNRNR